MRVLVVDDDYVDREMIRRVLEKSDMDAVITTALTVDEGLELLKSQAFDIVLSDYRMPQRDGIELIVEMRNQPQESSMAIVMMSSSENEKMALDCLQAGAQDFLIKSEITAPRLRRAVLQAQARFELEQKLLLSYQKVKSLAESDPLTGLANRYLFDESLKLSISNNARSTHKVALLLIDLDNFKNVNDSLGHDVGDLLLKKVVERISGCLRGNELFARLGGDEFAIILSNIESAEHSSRVARRIVQSLNRSINIANKDIKTSASIGIAIHPDNSSTGEELFKYADIAMCRAKKLGRNQISFFAEEMQKKITSRIHLESELGTAVSNNEFLLHFQPVVNPDSGYVHGFEALIRWNIHGNLRYPDSFIIVAEETRRIIEIGRWVIKESMSILANWNMHREHPYTLAINLSLVQLQDTGLVDYVASCLREMSIPASLIEFELTETALLTNSKESRLTIMQLHALGCRIALDDFGTGYSSVSHLQQFPISTVKIDKSIMPQDSSDHNNESLIRGLVSMAKILGLNIVAEGIEEKRHVELCVELELNQAQGYYFSKPLEREAIEKQYCITVSR